ncbi:LysR substrate-binding domain-containing protein [Streptomyces cellulosae]|uniref:LysR substrate-binding domain-containing protein n=1 Tax=Streptomyces cellulosae TaxID=1968 RepID=A0ABW7Y8W5_STRCE
MDSRVELRLLRSFSVLSGELHFGRAAQQLRIAQPALSQQIRQLERAVGVTLFERTSRSVALTRAGSVFAARVRDHLQRIEEDIEEARRVDRGESGRIDLAFISSAAPVVATITRWIADERPGVLLDLHEGTTESVLDHIERGTADLGIVRDAENRPGITLTTVRVEGYVAVLPRGHALVEEAQATAADLAGSPLVLFPRTAGSLAYARALQPFREMEVEPVIAFHASQWSSIFQLVAAGAGTTIAPESAADHVPAGVAVVPLGGTDTRTLVQVAHRAHQTHPIVPTLIDLLRTE